MTYYKYETTVSNFSVEKPKNPSAWNVIFHNDDTTPFDVVIIILVTIFSYNEQEAKDFADIVHTCGKAVAGTFSKEKAFNLQIQSTQLARGMGSKLLITCDEY